MSEFDMKHEELDEFEIQLTASLRHVDPPHNLAAQILARVEEGPQRFSPRPRKLGLIWSRVAALAAMLSLIAFGAERFHRHRQAQIARTQFDLAISITDHALQQTRQQLEHAGLDFGQ